MNIKVVSLNLWLGGKLTMNGVLEFLKQHDADVVLLQEVYDGRDPALAPNFRSVEVLRETLKYPYDDFAPTFLDNRTVEGKVEQGNFILSKFPIVDRNVWFFNELYGELSEEDPATWGVQPRNLQLAVLETQIGKVNVFNLQGVYDLDGDNYSERRQRMSETIIAEVKDRENVILAGDTNAKPTNKAMRAVEQYLVSVFGDGLRTSFNMRRKTNPGYATAVVDLMYVSSNIKVVSRDCPDVDISDHLPLVAELKLEGR